MASVRLRRDAIPESSTWDLLARRFSESGVAVLDGPTADPRYLLDALNLTERSALGALLANCGGVLIDHGWLRLFGGGAAHLPSLLDANQNAPHSMLDHLVVGFDVAGGRFAINGAGDRAEPGEVCYLAPDTLEWLPLGFGHSAFLSWALTENLDLFYKDLRWADWQDAVRRLAPDQALAAYPPPFAAEARSVPHVSRSPVPYRELLYFIDSMAEQLRDIPAGSGFKLRAEP